jgi:hypothetical protein
MTPEKHIEFVQQVITRMNGNSFQLKTWAVTLTAGLFALSERSNPWFALLALVPIFVFWLIDAYYLKLERRYRHLYDDLCLHAGTPSYAQGKHYSMKLSDYALPVVRWRSCAFSRTQVWIYFPLLVIVALVVTALKLLGPAAMGTSLPPH